MIAVFKNNGKIDILLCAVVAAIHVLVFSNAWRHDPRVGYDSEAHLGYISALARGHLPTPQQSYEFFSPPLPYLFPALLQASGLTNQHAAKGAQFLQAALSLGLFYFLIKICRLVSPARMVSFGAVVFTGVLPVYYKSFAFVRGEPFLAFFAMMSIYFSLKLFARNDHAWPNGIAAGVALGAGMISRQWGLLLLPAICVFAAIAWWHEKEQRHAIMRSLSISLIIALTLGAWFYVDLTKNQGTPIAFNRDPSARFSFNNQPRSFYFGIEPDLLFSKPMRPNFPNELIPIFYSETWGDYWCSFCIWGKDLRNKNARPLFGSWLADRKPWKGSAAGIATNYESMSRYLGRVNAMSTFPTLLAFAGVAVAVSKIRNRMMLLFLLVVVFSLAGYFWFLILYPNLGKGDTIKATYMLHLFPVLGVFVGGLLAKIEARRATLARGLLIRSSRSRSTISARW